jgi:hypothetical protein
MAPSKESAAAVFREIVQMAMKKTHELDTPLP